LLIPANRLQMKNDLHEKLHVIDIGNISRKK